jgi:hypothetical protein
MWHGEMVEDVQGVKLPSLSVHWKSKLDTQLYADSDKCPRNRLESNIELIPPIRAGMTE